MKYEEIKMKSFIELLKKDIQVSEINEGKQPLIGVFWLYNDEIIGDTRDPNLSDETVSQVIDDKKIVSGRFTHYDIWKKIKPEELKSKDYLFLPRGRIVSNDTNFKFIVFANKIFDDMKHRTMIKKYYNLSEKDIIWNFKELHYN